ncbi:MAG: glycosyltransferase family 39 protein, partial [Elusimicrobiota bacterium]
MMNAAKDRRRILLALALLAVAGLAWRWAAWILNPDSAFLIDRQDCRWVVADRSPSLQVYALGPTEAGFRRRFLLDRRVDDWEVTIHAMRGFRAGLDGRRLHPAPVGAGWKSGGLIRGEGGLEPGEHELLVIVSNRDGPPSLMVRGLGLPVSTGWLWEASLDGRTWKPTRPAADIRWPKEVLAYPDTGAALAASWPWLILAFTGFLAFMAAGGRLDDRAVKWIVVLGWAVLGLNNAGKLPAGTGFDTDLHLAYMRRILEGGSLPVPGEAPGASQFFQPPLYYLLSLPIYGLLAGSVSVHWLTAGLRVVPLLCGLGIIELTHRMSARVFPDRSSLRSVAVAVAGLCPMSIYMAQAPGNESLAALLTALTLALLLGFVLEPDRRRPWADFAVLGAVWGAAMLAKVTPVLLMPAIGAALARHFVSTDEGWKGTLARSGSLLGAALAVCGWFYLRNFLLLGRPFVGGWEAVGATGWWQEPGYRVWGQYLSFGPSLTRPVFAGMAGAWDSLHSTLWLDGFLGGNARHPPPWNMAPMLMGSLLGLIPAGLVLASLRAFWR